MKYRQICFLTPWFLILLTIVASGCRSSQNESSHMARKAARRAHPPLAAQAARPPSVSETDGDSSGTHAATIGSGTGTTTSSIVRDPILIGTPPESLPPLARNQQPPDHQEDGGEHAQIASTSGRKLKPAGTVRDASLDADQQLQNEYDNLSPGQIVFHHPSEMRMGEAQEVEVRISRDLKADLSQGLPATSDQHELTENQPVKVDTYMKVQLHGEPYFDVKALSDEKQFVSHTGFTEWRFTVIPLQGGKWPLHLTVVAVLHAGNQERAKDLEVLDEQVTVRVSPLEVVEAFLGNNWQWLIGTILIPIGAWLLPKFRKHKPEAKAA